MADRDPSTGRFINGNKASPGRAPRLVESNYLDTTFAAVSVEDWHTIVQRAVEDAKKGNSWARSWLGDYVLGKPPQILELRGADAALLHDLLEAFQRQGISATDIFRAMLAELTVPSNAEVNVDG